MRGGQCSTKARFFSSYTASYPSCFLVRHVGCECGAGLTGEHCEIRNAGNDEIIREPTSHQSGGSDGISGVAIFFIAFAALVASISLLILHRRLRNEKEEIDFDDDGEFDDMNGDPVIDLGPERNLDGDELENVEII